MSENNKTVHHKFPKPQVFKWPVFEKIVHLKLNKTETSSKFSHF